MHTLVIISNMSDDLITEQQMKIAKSYRKLLNSSKIKILILCCSLICLLSNIALELGKVVLVNYLLHFMYVVVQSSPIFIKDLMWKYIYKNYYIVRRFKPKIEIQTPIQTINYCIKLCLQTSPIFKYIWILSLTLCYCDFRHVVIVALCYFV